MRSLGWTRVLHRSVAFAAAAAVSLAGALVAPAVVAPAVAAPTAAAPVATGALTPPAAVVSGGIQPAATYSLDPAVSGQGVAAIQSFEKNINALRAKAGRKALKFNLYATQDAYTWSKTMAAKGLFRHTTSEAERPSMKRFAGSWAVWGENIGVRSNLDLNGMFQQWVDSPGHKANMLSADYDSYGIGFYTKRSGDKGPWALYATTVFYKTKPGKSLAGTYATVAAYQASRLVKPTAAAQPKPKVTGGSVAIKGTTRVGSTLKASVKRFSTASVKVSYRWYRNGKAISRATKSSYKLTAADKGKRLTLKMTGTRSGHTSRTVTSKRTAVIKAGVLGTKAVKASGTPKVGRKLTASTKAWAPGGVKVSYRWYRNGKAISGATKRVYSIKRADRGRSLKVKVTGSKSGYTTKSVTSRSTSRVK